jgi:hypothetical protein
VFPVQGQSLLSCRSCWVVFKISSPRVSLWQFVVMEQTVNIKFRFKTAETATENSQFRKQAYGTMLSLVHWFWTVFQWLDDLKMGVRIFRIMQEEGLLHPLKMHRQLHIAVKWWQVFIDGFSERWRMNLNINEETIRRIIHEDLRKREICPKFVPHRLTGEQKQRRLISR